MNLLPTTRAFQRYHCLAVQILLDGPFKWCMIVNHVVTAQAKWRG
jgi:hypothetical protein